MLLSTCLRRRLFNNGGQAREVAHDHNVERVLFGFKGTLLDNLQKSAGHGPSAPGFYVPATLNTDGTVGKVREI